MEKGVKERLIQYLKANDIKNSEFCQAVGVSSNFVNAIRKGISGELLLKIKDSYPTIDLDYLQYGDNSKSKILEDISIRKYCLEKALEKYSDPKDVISASILFYEWITK